MGSTRKYFFAICILLLCSFAFAEMTIYFKDGSSRQVNKIEFRDQQADLHLTNGTIITVGVSALDLPSSGIMQATGTYGSSEVRKSSQKGPTSSVAALSASEQAVLKNQWEAARETATALDHYGPVQRGDTVRILSRQEMSVTVVYRDAIGMYKKLMIDRYRFAEYFNTGKEASVAKKAPAVAIEKSNPAHEPAATVLEIPVTKMAVEPLIPDVKKEPLREVSGSSLMPAILLGSSVIVLVIAGSVVMLRKRNGLTLQPARISKSENELRNLMVRGWLGEGKTTKELVELCLNRFYADHPRLLGIGLKIMDGDPRSLVVASALRAGAKTAPQADFIYDQVKSTIDLSRSIINQVSSETGAYPLDRRNDAATAGVARAGIANQFRSSAMPQIQIVNRPAILTACAILLLISAIITGTVLFRPFPGLESLREAIGVPGLVVSVLYTLACAFGYWTMRKWAVLLYAIEPLLRWWADVPGHLVAIPVFIVAAGIIYLDDMTWS